MLHVYVFMPLGDPLDPTDPEQMAPLQEGIEARLGVPCIVDVRHRAYVTRPMLLVEGERAA